MHSQKALLERDISKQESFAGKRRDSLLVERSANQSLQVLSNVLFAAGSSFYHSNIKYFVQCWKCKVEIWEANKMYEIVILLQQISLCLLNLGIVQTLHEHIFLSFIIFPVESHISVFWLIYTFRPSEMLVLISTSHLSGRI